MSSEAASYTGPWTCHANKSTGGPVTIVPLDKVNAACISSIYVGFLCLCMVQRGNICRAWYDRTLTNLACLLLILIFCMKWLHIFIGDMFLPITLLLFPLDIFENLFKLIMFLSLFSSHCIPLIFLWIYFRFITYTILQCLDMFGM